MQDDQYTSNNTSILCILYKLFKIKAFLSENVLDSFINPKIYFNLKKLFCVEELPLQMKSTYKPYLCILDKRVFFLVSIYNKE